MEKGFKKALTIFKYLTILFAVVYWIGIVIDDWVFIQEYGTENWAVYIGIWLVWFLIYFFGFSTYYWGIAFILIFIYFKLFQKIK